MNCGGLLPLLIVKAMPAMYSAMGMVRSGFVDAPRVVLTDTVKEERPFSTWPRLGEERPDDRGGPVQRLRSSMWIWPGGVVFLEEDPHTLGPDRPQRLATCATRRVSTKGLFAP